MGVYENTYTLVLASLKLLILTDDQKDEIVEKYDEQIHIPVLVSQVLLRRRRGREEMTPRGCEPSIRTFRILPRMAQCTIRQDSRQRFMDCAGAFPVRVNRESQDQEELRMAREDEMQRSRARCIPKSLYDRHRLPECTIVESERQVRAEILKTRGDEQRVPDIAADHVVSLVRPEATPPAQRQLSREPEWHLATLGDSDDSDEEAPAAVIPAAPKVMCPQKVTYRGKSGRALRFRRLLNLLSP